MPSVRLIENVPCATPKCAHAGIVWCPDDRFIPFAEGERAGAWFCAICSSKPKAGLDASAFIVSPTIAWDAWAEIEAMENAVEFDPWAEFDAIPDGVGGEV